MKIKLIYLCVLIFIISGCVSKPNWLSYGVNSTMMPVSKKSFICIIVPQDAKEGNYVYNGSGNRIAKKIYNALKNDYYLNIVSKFYEGCDYIINTEIIRYEDKLAGYIPMPDIIDIKVNLTNVKTKEINSLKYSAESDLIFAHWCEWGNALPDDLLGREFKKQIRNLVK